MHYFVSILVLQSSRGRKKGGCFASIVLKLYCRYKRPVAFPHSAMCRFAVSDCGIS